MNSLTNSTWLTRALLIIAAGIICSLLSAWGLEKNSMDKSHDQRLTSLEKQYEVINAKLDVLLKRIK